MLPTAWSTTPQLSRPAALETSRRAIVDFTLATVTLAPQDTAVGMDAWGIGIGTTYLAPQPVLEVSDYLIGDVPGED